MKEKFEFKTEATYLPLSKKGGNKNITKMQNLSFEDPNTIFIYLNDNSLSIYYHYSLVIKLQSRLIKLCQRTWTVMSYATCCMDPVV